MSDPMRPKLYLNTPYLFEPDAFGDQLARALDAGPVACVRLRLKGGTEDEIKFAMERLRPICHSRDVALVISDFFRLAAEFGLDGAHFEPGSNYQTEARALLGPDAIIGVGCGVSRHHGLIAGERGADYVSFGPVAQEPGLATGPLAERELFAWWQEMIELPVVAEGGISPELAGQLVGAADFVAASRSVWLNPKGPDAGVRAYHAAFDRALEAAAA